MKYGDPVKIVMSNSIAPIVRYGVYLQADGVAGLTQVRYDGGLRVWVRTDAITHEAG